MEERARVEIELAQVEQLILDTTARCRDLENAVGVMARVGGDTSAADAALLASYQALGLQTRRRATLMRMLASWGDGRR